MPVQTAKGNGIFVMCLFI